MKHASVSSRLSLGKFVTETVSMKGTVHDSNDELHAEESPEPRGRRLSNGKRFLVAAGIVVLVVAVLGGTKFAQISGLISAGKAAEAAAPAPEAGATDVAGPGA